MKTATISHARDHLSALLQLVRRGESVLILDRNRPVARLVPVEPGDESDDAWVSRLEREGILRRGDGRSILEVIEEPPPPCEGDVLGALLAEREEGR